MNFFPAYIEDAVLMEGPGRKAGPPREYGIDFKTGQLTGGIAEGKEAVKVWIWLALQVPRYRHYIYTWDYGNEFEDLIGQAYSEEYTAAEAQRMVEECLLVNGDIRGISEFAVSMSGDALSISFTAETAYGSIGFEDYAVARPE